jgi:hypothetical protein
VIAQERTAARAKLSAAMLREAAEAAPLLAADDAAAQAAREAAFCRVALDTATGVLAAVQELRQAAGILSGRLTANASEIPLAEIPAALRSATAAMKDAIALGEAAIALERKRLGDPSEIIGVKPIAADRPLAELSAEVLAAQRALARVQAGAEGSGANGH